MNNNKMEQNQNTGLQRFWTGLGRRLTSLVLAATMVLSFLPAGLLPVAQAANTPLDGADGSDGGFCIDGSNAGKLYLKITDKGKYTLELVPSITADGVTLGYSIFPTFNPGGSMNPIKTDIGKELTNASVDYMSVDPETAPYIHADAPHKADLVKLNLKSGVRVKVAEGYLRPAQDLYEYLNTNFASSADANGGFEYIVVFNTSNASRLQWTYATVAPSGVQGTDFDFVRGAASITTSYNITSSASGLSLPTDATGTGGTFKVGNADLKNAYLKFDLHVPAGGSVLINYNACGLVAQGSTTILAGNGTAFQKDLPKNTTYYLLMKASKTIAQTSSNHPVTGTVTLVYHDDVGNEYEETINVRIRIQNSTYLTATGGITITATEGVDGGDATGISVDTSSLGLAITTGTIGSDHNAKYTSSTSTNSWTTIAAPAAGGAITTSNLGFGLTSGTGGGLKLTAQGLNSYTYSDTLTMSYDVVLRVSNRADVYGTMTLDIPVTIVIKKAEVTPTSYTVKFYSPDDATLYATKTTDTAGKISASDWPTNPTKTGAKFTGWNTAANGSGTTVTQSSFTTNKNTELYAQWEAIEYTLTLDPGDAGSNGALPITSISPVLYNNTVNYSQTLDPDDGTPPTWTGHTFLGWAESATATTATWTSASGTITMPAENKTYYAIWTETEYTVTYDPNGGAFTSGANPTNNRTATATAAASVTLPAVKQNGYSHDGWTWAYTSGTPSTTGTLAAADTSYTINGLTTNKPGDLTLTAKWKADAVTLDGYTVNATVGTALNTTVTQTDLNAKTGTWMGDTYAWQVWDGSQWTNTHSITSDGTTITVTVDGTTGYTVTSSGAPLTDVSAKFLVRAQSNTNNLWSCAANTTDADDFIVVKVPAPPKITGGSTTSNPSPIVANGTVTLNNVSLDNSTTTANIGPNTTSNYVKAEWYLGTTTGAAGANAAGPTMSNTIASTDGKNITVPSNATADYAIWLKLTGDGVHVHSQPYWIKLEINKVTALLTFEVLVKNAAGTVITTPNGFSATGGGKQLEAGKTTQLTANTTASGYTFLGWATLDKDGAVTTPTKATAGMAAIDLSGGSTFGTVGATATYTMPTPAAANTIYAVYQAVSTADLTVGVVVNQPGETPSVTTTKPSEISISSGKTGMAAGDTYTVATSTSSGDYVFKGWSTVTDGTTASTITNFTLTTGTAGGSAEFKMPPTPTAATIYAVYEKVPSYDVTVKMNPGVSSVTVSGGTQKGNIATDATTNVKTAVYTVKRGTTLTVVTNPTAGYDADGFTLTGNTTTNYTKVLDNAATSFICVVKGSGLTITAKAKLKPPILQLSPTTGYGSVDNPGVTSGKEPKVTVTNVGGATATVKANGITVGPVTVGGTSYTFTYSGLAAGGTVATGSGNAATITITPPSNMPAGTYTIPVSIAYNNDDISPATVNVTYVVAETTKFTGEVTVKLDGSAATNAVSTLYTVSGNTWTAVATGGTTGVATSTTGGVTTYTGLAGGTNYSIKVDLDGSGTDYSPVEVKNITVNTTTKKVEVNFYTVTVQMGNDSEDADQASVTGDGNTVTLGLNSATVSVQNTTEIGTKKLTAAIQKDVLAKVSAAPSNTTNFAFEKWTTAAGDSTAPSPYTFAVTEAVTYTAHMKKAGEKVVVTYLGNATAAGTRNTIDSSASPVVKNVPSAEVKEVGATGYKITSTVPTLAGYIFKEWNTAADGTGTAYASGANGPDPLNANLTLYAIWDDVTISATDVEDKETSYGANYSDAAGVGAKAVKDGTTEDLGLALKYSAAAASGQSGLPGGLSVNADTGAVSGRPYQVSAVSSGSLTPFVTTVTVTLAQDYHKTANKVKQTATYSITVDKAQPTVTSVTATGAIASGANINTVGFTVTVTGPRYNTDAAGKWEEAYTDTITYAVGFTNNGADSSAGKTAGLGKVSFSPTSFSSSAASTEITASFTPLTVGTGGTNATDFDSHTGNKQDTVWKTATGKKTFAHNGDTYDFEVSADNGTTYAANASWLYATETTGLPAHAGYSSVATGTDGYVAIVSGGADTVNAKDFILRATGNKPTGKLSYSFGKSSSSPFSVVEVKGSDGNADPDYLTASNVTSVDAGDTIKLRIKPNGGQAAGTYTDTLTITGADGGSATILVTFVVTEAKTFDATVTVKKQDTTAGSTLAAGPVPSGLSVKVMDDSTAAATLTESSGSGATGVTVAYDATNEVFTISGLDVTKVYTIVVTGTGGGAIATYTVPGKSLSNANAAARAVEVDLYQVNTTYDTDAYNALTQTGAGYYVSGQNVNISTPATAAGKTGTGNAGKSYNFKNWTWPTNQSSTDRVFTGTTVTAPMTFTANYIEQNAKDAVVNYYENAPGSTGGGDLLTAKTEIEGVGGSHTVLIMKPSLPGYIFDYWTTKDDGTGDKYANPAAGVTDAADTITNLPETTDLFAHWTRVTLTGAETDTLTGTYGVALSYDLPKITVSDNGAITYSIDTSDGSPSLPGGLYINPNTGAIYGKPYEVTEGTTDASGIPVKVKATYTNDTTLTKTITVTIKVNKYQLYLTDTSVTNVVSGQDVGTGTYGAKVVSAPILTTKGTPGTGGVYDPDHPDVWDDPAMFTENVTLANGVKGTSDKGTLSLTTSGNFGTVTSVGLEYAPSTKADTTDPDSGAAVKGDTDANGSTHSAIYKKATATVTPSAGSATYTMKVAENNRVDGSGNAVTNEGAAITMKGPKVGTNPPDGFVANVGYEVKTGAGGEATGTNANGSTGDGTGGTTANEVQAQLFTLTNTGNQATGALKYRFGTAGADNTQGSYFAIGNDTLPASLAAAGAAGNGDRDTFTVVPRKGLTPDTYRDTLVITNAGNVSVTVALTFTVSKAAVPVEVKTYHWAVGDDLTLTGTNKETKLQDLVRGAVVLKPVTGATASIPDVALNDHKEASDGADIAGDYIGEIDYDTAYYVEVNGYRLRDANGQYIEVTRDTSFPLAVDLYQVTTATDPTITGTTDLVPTTKAPTVKNSANQTAGALAAGNKTGSFYVVKGESANITAEAAAAGYQYKDMKAATKATPGVGDWSQIGTTRTVSTTINVPTAIKAVYAEGYTLHYEPDGGSLPTGTPNTDLDDVTGLTAGDVVTVKGGGLSKEGYVFKGWQYSYTPDGASAATTGTVHPGDAFTMPAANVTLTAQWEATGGALVLPDTTVNAYYGEALPTGTKLAGAVGLTGTGTYSFNTGVASPTWWDPALAVAGNGGLTGTPALWDGSNPTTAPYTAQVTAGVKVVDGANSKEATGTLTVNIAKADTQVRTGSEPTPDSAKTFVPGGKFGIGDLTKDTDGSVKAIVDALHSSDWQAANPDGDAKLSPDIPGTWTIQGADSDGKLPIGSGPKQTITLVFTPTDSGFKPTTHEIEIDVAVKAINGVNIEVNFPATGEVADQLTGTTHTVQVKADTDVTDTVAGTPDAGTADVVIKSVTWVGLDSAKKFDTTKDTTLIVVLTPKYKDDGTTDWPFVDAGTTFTGHFRTPTGGKLTSGTPAAEVNVTLNHSSGEAVLTYTWPAEDKPFDIVNVKVDQPAVGPTSNSNVTSAEPTKYDIKYVWVEQGAPATSPATEFDASKLYDLIVTFTPVKGWEFGPHFAGIADGASMEAKINASDEDNTLIAQVNGTYAPIDHTDSNNKSKHGTNTAEGATNDALPGTLVVRYSSFRPTAKTIVGIEWVSGTLHDTLYYAATATDKKENDAGKITDVLRATDAYGHSAYGPVYKQTFDNTGDKDGKLFYRLKYGDNTYSDAIEYTGTDGEALVYGSAPNGTLPTMPTAGHVFTNDLTDADNAPFVSGVTDQATFDGKNVYIAYTSGSTFYAAAPIGTLTVRELEAQKIAPSRPWTAGELTFVAGVDTFAVPTASNAITATVDFNADCDLSKQEIGFAHNNTQTNGNNTHYYKWDSDGDGDLTDETPLTTGTAMTTAMNGKTLYICYTDINGNEVSAPVGALRTSGETTLKVWIDNPTPGTTDPKKADVKDATGSTDPDLKGSEKPEYGETVKAVIEGTPTGPVEYKWYRQDVDADGDPKFELDGVTPVWVSTPIGADPTYTLKPEDIGLKIKVDITEGGTSGTATSVNFPVGQKRTLKLDVTSINKNYDGTAANGHTYATGNPATAANDFYLYNVINDDKVYVSGYTGTDKPNYAAATVGSEITWPAIDDTSRDYYTLGGANEGSYRLGAQDAIAHRGEILADGVIHVDVSFQEKPIFDHVIPNQPMGVTDLRQTRPATSGTGTVANAAAFAGVTAWYKDTDSASYTPNGNNTALKVADVGAATPAKFGTGTYTVEVKVKPVAGYNYTEAKTKFYFHFGVDEQVEVEWPTKAEDGATVYHGLVPNDDGTSYTMYYTFTAVARVKIAHVNVSIPQPVVEGHPASGSVNQALGTDSSDRKNDVTMENVTWYKGANGSDTISSSDAFAAGGVYRVEFDLTTANGYQYLNKNGTPKDAADVSFTVSGVGPIEGAGSGDVTDNTVITSVTTSLPADVEDGTDNGHNADTKYHVTVVYKAIKGGKVNLTDIVVDASAANAAGIEKTGPAVADEKKPIYDLTKGGDGNYTADHKWQYWNGTAWADASDGTGLSNDGKFKAGYDYRVTAKVKLVATEHYLIGEDTKFYLAGLECTTSTAPAYHPASGEKELKKNDDGTYTLIKEFSIPANKIDLITVTYPEPVAGNSAQNYPDTYDLKTQVTIGDGDSGDSVWKTVTNQSAPTGAASFAGTKLNTNFADGTYYMVESTIHPNASSGYAFKTGSTESNKAGNTQVTINGVLVTVGGAMGVKKDAKGTDIGWAIATYDGTKNVVIAKYIAKTAALDKIITSVTTGVTAPSAGAAQNDTDHAKSNTTQALNGSGYIVTDLGLVDGGDVTATWAGTFENTDDFKKGESYTVTYTLTTKDGYTFLHGIKDGAIEKHAAFVIQGVTVDTWEIKDGKVTGTGTKGSGDDALTVEVTELTTTTAKVKITYPKVGDDESIQQVTVDYTVPKEGDAPAKSTIYTPTAQVKLGATKGSDPLEYNDLKDDRTVGSTWFDASTLPNSGNGMATDGSVKFDNGDYVVLAHFTANDGFKFTDDTTFTVNGTTYKKEASNSHVTIATGGKSATVWHTFPGQDKVIVRVAANATQPVAGDAIPTSAAGLLLAQNKDGDDMTGHVTVGNMSWTLADGSAIPAGDGGKFVVGKSYKVSFDVTAKDAATGYHFLAHDATTDPVTAKDYVDFLINNVLDGTAWIDGETAAGGVTDKGLTVTTAKKDGSSDAYTITVTFPQTGTTADVLTVWGIAAPKAGDTISVNGLTVPASEPYEKVSGADTKWMHWELKDSSDPTQGYEWKDVTSGSFLPGHTYKAVIKTQIKSDKAGKYQFTSTTAGYVNDTTAYNNQTDNTMVGTKVAYTKGSGTADHPQYVTVEKVFPLEKQVIDVHVSSLKPTKGNALPTDITVPSAYQTYYEFENVGTDTKWSGTLDGDGHVVEAEVYTMTVKVKPKDGYKLPTGSDVKSHYFWDENSAVAVTHTGDENGATVTFTFTLGGNAPQPKDPVVYIEPPVKDKALDSNPISPNTSVKPTLGGTTWTDASGNPVTTGKAGGTFTAKIYIEANSPDGDRTYKENDTIDLDGTKVTVHKDDDGKLWITRTWTLPSDPPPQTITVPGGGGGGGGTTVIETPVVTYALRDLGVTLDLTAEKVKKNQSPKAVPKVEGIEGLKFVGWSETDPSKLKDGKLPTLVDPKTFKITDDKTFYAVYEKLADEFDHTHYVIGFPDGTFGPDHNITRGQVATIIARSCLENFIEGSNYGNPGNYTDVESHWAFSAISYCSMNGVFTGYGDGTFRPDQPITRQELATVVARLAGVQVSKGLPFSDAGDIASWALNGVYTNYANGWVNGYTDGTFKPLNDISRAETVKIFNGYLTRGTDKEGLSELREYVHSGVASNNTENGKDEYMTWPDVAKTHWAYYEIIEAANDHNFHWRDLEKETPPEDWYECYIDEKWRYNDDANDGPDDVGRQDTLPTLTVTYVVQSNGVVWDSITEEVTQYSSPDPAKLPQAEPSEGWRFAGWSETDPDTGVVTLIDPTAHPVLENKTFYAVFERDVPAELPNVTITYVIGDHGSTDMALTETIKMWESPTVEHLPKIAAHEGWRFAGWSETDPASGTVTLTDPTDHPALADATFYAVYEQEKAPELPPVTVTYVIGGQGSTQAALTETLKQYESPTVAGLPQVTANEGWTFLGWSETDPASGAWALVDPTAVSILADKSFYAVYEAVQPQQPEQPGETQQPQQPEQPGETQQPEQPVEYARYSYINGYTDNTFRPDAAFTRAAVATVIANLKGYDPSASYEGYAFDDLDGHWGANAIAFCVSQGLMSGYTDNTFRPDNAISRQEFAVVLCRLAGKSESGELPFTDVDSIASWALDSVYTAYANGWINGYDDGSFLPERDVTRAEAVKMFNGYLGRSADRESIESQTGYTVWEDVPETHWAYFEIIEASNSWAK